MSLSEGHEIPKKQLLGQILIKKNLITPAQLKEALDIHQKEGRPLGVILIERGHVTEKDIVVALILQCGFTYLAVNKYEIQPEVLRLVRSDFAKKYQVLPLERIGNILNVAMSDPLDFSAQDELEHMTHCKIKPLIATKTEIEEAISRYYKNEG